MTESRKILVHACCVACFSHVHRELSKAGFAPIAYFYNPEIDDFEEYHKRVSDLKNYCLENDLQIIVPDRAIVDFSELIEPFKDKNSLKFIGDKDRYRRRRCQICNSLRLQKTVEQARKLRLKFFTTTLLCSPYKDHDQIVDLANEKALDYNLSFYYQDFRKGYWMGRNYARNHKVHIPAFCGCTESQKERRLE